MPLFVVSNINNYSDCFMYIVLHDYVGTHYTRTHN